MQEKSQHITHITDEEIAALVDATLPAQRCKQIVLHLASCVNCRKVVSETVVSQLFIDDPNAASS